MAIETPEQFRAVLAQLGLTQTKLARKLVEFGDPRPYGTIIRSVQRMALGESKVSGEMHALLGLIARLEPPSNPP
jgi:hypothetical protein